jgi:hypothetical protein
MSQNTDGVGFYTPHAVAAKGKPGDSGSRTARRLRPAGELDCRRIGTRRRPRRMNAQSGLAVSDDRWLWHAEPYDTLSERSFDPGVSLAKVSAETALMSAVLEDAFRCFQKKFEIESPSVRREAEKAEKWFVIDESNWPFSFVSICDVLGLEPRRIRNRLEDWRRSYLDKSQGKI